MAIQKVRYPGQAPPSATAQALLGFLKGAGGYMGGVNTAQAGAADRQATAQNAVVGPLINQGHLGPGPGYDPSNPFANLTQRTPTPDALNPLETSRKRQIDLKVGDVQSDAFTRLRVENDVDDRLLNNSGYQRLIRKNTKVALAEAARMRKNLIDISMLAVEPSGTEEAVAPDIKDPVADFFKGAAGAVGAVSPAANIYKMFNPKQEELPKPPDVAQEDWDLATTEEKKSFLKALGQ